MRKYWKLADGKFVSITTRKANHAEAYYAKATIWESQEAYNNGDCKHAYTISNFYLCALPEELETQVYRFAKHIEAEETDYAKARELKRGAGN